MVATRQLDTSVEATLAFILDLFENPTRPLPSLDEARPHLTFLFSHTLKNYFPDLARATNTLLPSRPSFPARDRSDSFEEHERRRFSLTVEYFMQCADAVERNIPNYWKNLNILQLVSYELPRLRALLEKVKLIIEHSQKPTPVGNPWATKERFTLIPVSALFSNEPLIWEDLPLPFTEDSSDKNDIDEEIAAIMRGTVSTSSSPIDSSFSVSPTPEWEMDPTWKQFIKTSLPERNEIQMRKISESSAETGVDCTRFRFTTNVVNADAFLAKCRCEKHNKINEERAVGKIMERMRLRVNAKRFEIRASTHANMHFVPSSNI